MMHSSIMICCCCNALSSVQRPWRMRSTTLRTDGLRDVNGAATDASPGRTMTSCMSILEAISSTPAPAGAPCKGYCLLTSSVSRFISSLIRPITVPNTWMLALNPVDSPRAARAASSSCTNSCCRDISSFCLLARMALRVAMTLAALWLCSAACLFSNSSLSPAVSSSVAVLRLDVLAFPYPQRSAIPTEACFNAPTSLPPSPHISTLCPWRCCSALITFVLPWGDIRAYTLMHATSSHNRPSDIAAAASSDASVTIRS
mmetsp:Transcript_38303/g.63553  ORF Transcript_38303/g.63553 Transcript_38303/m.63553 type:complete len:259 (-) Transcript_38303:2112-2888(-)